MSQRGSGLKRSRTYSAFTLIELMIAISLIVLILTVLIALLFLGIRTAREYSPKNAASLELRQLERKLYDEAIRAAYVSSSAGRILIFSGFKDAYDETIDFYHLKEKYSDGTLPAVYDYQTRLVFVLPGEPNPDSSCVNYKGGGQYMAVIFTDLQSGTKSCHLYRIKHVRLINVNLSTFGSKRYVKVFLAGYVLRRPLEPESVPLYLYNRQGLPVLIIRTYFIPLPGYY